MNKLLLKLFVCSLLCLSFASISAHTYKGELKILIFDDFEHHKSKMEYQLHEGNTIYQLDFPKTVNKNNLHTGDLITVEGNIFPGSQEQGRIKIQSIYLDKAVLESQLKMSRKS